MYTLPNSCIIHLLLNVLGNSIVRPVLLAVNTAQGINVVVQLFLYIWYISFKENQGKDITWKILQNYKTGVDEIQSPSCKVVSLETDFRDSLNKIRLISNYHRKVYQKKITKQNLYNLCEIVIQSAGCPLLHQKIAVRDDRLRWENVWENWHVLGR